MSIIIGLSGKKQSGKSSLALYLQAFFELRLSQTSFEDNELKQSKDGQRVYLKIKNDEIEWKNWKQSQEINSSLKKFEQELFQLMSIENKIVNAEPEIIKSIEQVRIYSFADPIKEFCIDVLGVSHEQVYGTDDQKNVPTEYRWETFPSLVNVNGKKGQMTAREIMQVFGTDIMRNMFSQGVWVNACLRRIKKENPTIAIIADLRFPSELHPILDSGGYVVRLGRKLFEDNHPSETSLDDCDWSSLKNVLEIGPEIGMEEKNRIVTSWISKIIEQKEVVNVSSREQVSA